VEAFFSSTSTSWLAHAARYTDPCRPHQG
jgi:hypothetical protein